MHSQLYKYDAVCFLSMPCICEAELWSQDGVPLDNVEPGTLMDIISTHRLHGHLLKVIEGPHDVSDWKPNWTNLYTVEIMYPSDIMLRFYFTKYRFGPGATTIQYERLVVDPICIEMPADCD
jgi:hypothetical protein